MIKSVEIQAGKKKKEINQNKKWLLLYCIPITVCYCKTFEFQESAKCHFFKKGKILWYSVFVVYLKVYLPFCSPMWNNWECVVELKDCCKPAETIQTEGALRNGQQYGG